MGEQIVPKVLEMQEGHTLFEKFEISQRGGVVGGDYKDKLSAASMVNNQTIIPIGFVGTIEQKIDYVYESLESYLKTGIGFMINDWKIFEEKVLKNNNPQKIVWFSDDFIPTMFEMKFIEQLLCEKPNITFYIIPRVLRCRNDILKDEIVKIIETYDVYKNLKKFYNQNRFIVFDKGPDVGTFDGERLSYECADLLIDSDILFISGSRSLEMGQGINKPTFYIGVAVCRTYSETISGISSNAGGLIMVYSENGNKVFSGFKKRGNRQFFDNVQKKYFPVAEMTIMDYVKKRDENSK